MLHGIENVRTFMKNKGMEELINLLEGNARVFKYTSNGIIEKPKSVIQEWVTDFPEYFRSFSPNSGRVIFGKSLYRVYAN